MFKFINKNKTEEILYSPIEGNVIDLGDVNDNMFANKLLGDGVAFELKSGEIKSPCNGVVGMIAPTRHALGLISSIGTEIIIHVGLDTVNLNGEGFEVLVREHQKVNVGQTLLKVNQEFMKQKGIDLTTPMIITNGTTLHMNILHTDSITHETPLMEIKKVG